MTLRVYIELSGIGCAATLLPTTKRRRIDPPGGISGGRDSLDGHPLNESAFLFRILNAVCNTSGEDSLLVRLVLSLGDKSDRSISEPEQFGPASSVLIMTAAKTDPMVIHRAPHTAQLDATLSTPHISQW